MKRKITFVMVVVIIAMFLGFVFLGMKETLAIFLHIYGVVMLLVLLILVIMRLISRDQSDIFDDHQKNKPSLSLLIPVDNEGFFLKKDLILDNINLKSFCKNKSLKIMRKIMVIILLVCMVIFALGCWCFGLYETLYVGVIIYIVMTFFLMVVLALSFFRRRRENDELKQLFLFIISSSFLAVSAGRGWRDFLYHSLDICNYKCILFPVINKYIINIILIL